MRQDTKEVPTGIDLYNAVGTDDPPMFTVNIRKFLDADEGRHLRDCEEILHKGLGTFFQVGQALLVIRTRRLYRQNYPAFEAYCHERWSMGRSYAWRLISAAERIQLLPAGGDIPYPTNECQMRPFLKVKPEEFPKAWKQAMTETKNGKISSETFQKAPARTALTSRQRKSKAQARKHRFADNCSEDEILALLHEIRRRVERGAYDEVLAGTLVILTGTDDAKMNPTLSSAIAQKLALPQVKITTRVFNTAIFQLVQI